MIFTLETFYTSNEWRKFRETFIAERLARDGELIDEETSEVIIDPSKVVLHHKIHLTEENVNNREISLNPKNIELVSEQTHTKIHDRFNCNGRKIYIAKKIEDVKIRYDLIDDFDLLKKAIGDISNSLINDNVWVLYNSIIDQIRTRRGKWTTAVVISNTTQIEYNRLKKLLGASDL